MRILGIMGITDKLKQAKEFLKHSSREEIVEEVYSKKIFPVQAKIGSTIADILPIPLQDVILATKLVDPFLPKDSKAKEIMGYVNLALKPFDYSAKLYLLHSFRLPLEEKLDIEHDIEPILKHEALQEDLERLCTKISSYEFTPPSLTEVNQKAERYTASVTKSVDGVDICSTKRVKTSLFVQSMSKAGVGGQYSPLTQEVFLPKTEHITFFTPFALCHEKVHSKGHIKEYEANTLAYIACHRGDDVFKYSADMVRINYTLSVLADMAIATTGPEAINVKNTYKVDLLQTLSLPEQSKEQLALGLQEISKGKSFFKYGFTQLSDYMLKARGESEGNKSYSEKFLKVIRAYERRVG